MKKSPTILMELSPKFNSFLTLIQSKIFFRFDSLKGKIEILEQTQAFHA
jgi:hypothetical protein